MSELLINRALYAAKRVGRPSVDPPSESDAHPTMKPLALVDKAITNSSRPERRGADLFLGSETTLIAAERTGRVCLGMELDVHYGSVVLARGESFSGETARCLGSL